MVQTDRGQTVIWHLYSHANASISSAILEASSNDWEFQMQRDVTLMIVPSSDNQIRMIRGVMDYAVQAAREAARRMSCQNNLKQLGLALHNYHDTNRRFPIGADSINGLSWRVRILPFIEQSNLYQRFSFDAGIWNGGPNREGPNKMVHALNKIPGFNCPSIPGILASNGSSTLVDGRKTYTSDYHGVAGPKGTNPSGTAYNVLANPSGQGGFATQGILGRDSTVRIGDIQDGTSNTLAIGEVSVRLSTGVILESDGADWIRGMGLGGTANGMASCRNVQNAINTPYNGIYNDISFGSLHTGGAQFVMSDGSVRFMTASVDLVVYKSTASRDGGETQVAAAD